MKAMTLKEIEDVFRKHPCVPGKTPLFEVDHTFNGRRQTGIDCSEKLIRIWVRDTERYVIFTIEPLDVTQENMAASIASFGTAD
jgi:hypothetical protein